MSNAVYYGIYALRHLTWTSRVWCNIMVKPRLALGEPTCHLLRVSTALSALA